MAISFQNQDVTFTLKEKSRIREWIKSIIAAEKKKTGRLDFVFASDEAVLRANMEFLNHNTYTDIITFDDCEGATINGDIIISIDRVKDNSEKFGTEMTMELKRVMIHGVLHLCGYKDKSKADAALMRRKEDWALKKY